MIVNLLLWCLFGLVAGAVAQFIMPGKDPGESASVKGFVITILLGIAGSVVGGLIGNALGFGTAVGTAAPDLFDWRSMLLAIGGALLVLLAYRAFRMLSSEIEPSAPERGLGNFDAHANSATTNLTDTIRHAVTPDVLQKLSTAVGESPTNTRKALDAMIPTILAGAANQAASTSGANRLFEMAKDSVEGGTNALNNLAGGGVDAMGRTGQGFLDSIFGDKLNGLLSWFAKFAGIKSESAASLMGVTSNLVMNTLGTQSRNNGLNASGLSTLLSGQKNWLAQLLPSGLPSVPGLNALTEHIGHAGTAVRDAAGYGARAVAGAARDSYRAGVGAAQATKPWLSAVAPLLVLGLAACSIPFIARGCAKNETTVARRTDGPTPNTPPSGGNNTGIRVSAYQPDQTKFVMLKLPDGASFELPESSFLHGLHKHITDANETGTRVAVFENLTFEGPLVKTAPESERSAKVLAALVKSFPGVTIHITGHTDNAGDADSNQRLSLERANAVKELLVKLGAPADRISTEGKGAEKPVASNDTEENRAKDRRVELTVAKKQ